MVDPAKVQSTLEHVRSMGARETPHGVRKLLNKKQKVSREVIIDRKSTCIKECTHALLFLKYIAIKRS